MFLDWFQAITTPECPAMGHWKMGRRCLFVNSSLASLDMSNLKSFLDVQLILVPQLNETHYEIYTTLDVTVTEWPLQKICHQPDRSRFAQGFFPSNANMLQPLNQNEHHLQAVKISKLMVSMLQFKQGIYSPWGEKQEETAFTAVHNYGRYYKTQNRWVDIF